MNTQHTLRGLVIAGIMLAILPQTATAAVSDLEVTSSTDPFPVPSGEDARLRIEIQNTGDTWIRDVNLTFEEDFPLSLEEGEALERELGDISPGSTYQVSTDIVVSDDAVNNRERMELTLEASSSTLTDRIPIEIQTGEVDLQLGNIVTSPRTLRTGTETNQVTVEVLNTGDKAAENVILNLGFPYGVEYTSSLATRKALGTIQPGKTKPATITIDLNESLDEGAMNVDGTVSYANDDRNERAETPVSFDLFLDGAPQFTIENVTADLRAGGSGQIRATVRNTGDVEASSTRLRVLDNADMPFSFDSASQYVGTLEPGQSGVAVFETDVDADADVKQHLLDLEARGAQGTTIFVDEETAGIDVAEPQNQDNESLPLGMIAAIIGGFVLLAGGYLLGRARGSEQEDSEDAEPGDE